MKAFSPKISVKLIKAAPRKDLVEGLPVSAERYGGLAAIDLTPFLGDGDSVRISKSVRECGGGFTISVADRAHADGGAEAKAETLSALIEPMDLIEIRMCRNPADHAEGKGYKPPVVMRGFVSEVTRNETISGDHPNRSVTIAGQDFGKILQIIQIFYLNNSVVGDNVLSQLAFFHKYGDPDDAKEQSANDFLKSLVEKLVNPYLKDLVALANGESVGAKVVNEWTVNADVEGVVSPFAVSSFNNVNLDQMLSTLLDVGPFNELYVEDLEDGVQLVLRPAPFLDVKGEPIQGVRPDPVEAKIDEVVSIGLTRTDAGVANYFWVTDSRWTMMSNEDAQMAAQFGSPDSFILFEYPNAKASLYGVRKMEVPVSLGPPGYSNTDAPTAEALPDQTASLGGWIESRRKILADANKDNVLFEHGSLRMRGSERFKPGMQLLLERGGGKVSSFYIVRVDHDFRMFQGYMTTLTVERGTNFIARSQAEKSLYFIETSGGLR